MVYFWAVDRPSESLRQLETEWSGVIRGEVAFHEIQGDHSSILLPPNAAAMARILTEYLKAPEIAAGLKVLCSELEKSESVGREELVGRWLSPRRQGMNCSD